MDVACRSSLVLGCTLSMGPIHRSTAGSSTNSYDDTAVNNIGCYGDVMICGLVVGLCRKAKVVLGRRLEVVVGRRSEAALRRRKSMLASRPVPHFYQRQGAQFYMKKLASRPASQKLYTSARFIK